MKMDPNCGIVARISTPEDDQAAELAAVALWSELALAVREIARDPKYASLSPEFNGWGYTDPEE